MSIVSGILGGNKANTSALDKKQQALVKREEELYDALLGNYQSNARNGAYDPNAQLDALKADNAYASKVSAANAATSARILGYRPGDSEPLLAQAAIGRKSELAYDDAANAIRNSAVDRGSQALASVAGVGGGILSNGIGAYDSMIQRKIQQASQPSGIASLLGSVTPFLMGRNQPAAPSFSLPSPTYYGGSMPGNYLRR